MIDELKPCPFCGGTPRVFSHNNEWIGRTWHIECLDDNCGCGTCHHESEKIAATVWNRRVETSTAEIERLREALYAYTEYCNICHGRGHIIEEDIVTEKELWRDCPGCTPARAALGEKNG